MALLLFSFSGNNQKEKLAPTYKKKPVAESVLASPFKQGKLIVLIDNNSFSYNHYKDTIVGFEYEILNFFCQSQQLDLEFVVTKDPANIIENLEEGPYHMAASNLNITADRKEKINFTQPYTRANELIVQRLPKQWEKMSQSQINKHLVRDRLELTNEEIFVKKKSSHVQFLTNLKTENGLDIKITEGGDTEMIDDLVEKVNSSQINYAIISSNAAIFYKNQFPDLDFRTPISMEHTVAFPIKKNQPELLSCFNNWLEEAKRKGLLATLKNKYFGNHRSTEEGFELNWELANNKRISPYDEIVKQVAHKYDIDWLCLMALIYQESKFDPRAKSWVGARGLTQVMPRTAAEYGINNPNRLYKPRVSIETGAKHYKYLYDLWKRDLGDSIQAVNFSLASYNAGRGHVMDGQRLANHLSKNPDIWDSNVESMMLLKSKQHYYRNQKVVKYGFMMGKETVTYVHHVKNYYKIFSEIVEST